MTDLFTIAELECRSALRLKWVQLLTAAFAMMAVAAAYSAGAAAELSGADGLARTTMTLVPVVLILIPLGALILGVSAQTVDAGSEPFLFAHPVGRTTILLGRWLGELGALGGAAISGFGAGAVLLVAGAGPAGVSGFASFVGLAVVLTAIFLALAALIASAVETRSAALGIATFVWFFFVLLYDGLMLSLAGHLTGLTGGRVLFGSVFGNPVDVIRIAMLMSARTSSVLGAVGEAWTRFLGGDVRAVLVSAFALTLWIAGPLAAAAVLLRRRDL